MHNTAKFQEAFGLDINLARDGKGSSAAYQDIVAKFKPIEAEVPLPVKAQPQPQSKSEANKGILDKIKQAISYVLSIIAMPFKWFLKKIGKEAPVSSEQISSKTIKTEPPATTVTKPQETPLNQAVKLPAPPVAGAQEKEADKTKLTR